MNNTTQSLPTHTTQFSFELETTDSGGSKARVGKISTPHGIFETPAFMAVGTRGVVKTMTPSNLREAGSSIILANAYHLSVRPGEELVATMGGLHRFMGWNGPILTDSGGFQIFSLTGLRKIDDNGVCFHSHVDGQSLFFTPERVMEIQQALGSDIIMPLDHCVGWPCTYSDAQEATHRSLQWARRSLSAKNHKDQTLFGIIQGCGYADLREWSAREMLNLDFPGYAIGGLSVGEPKEVMLEMIEKVTGILPPHKPRYLMGVGAPEDLLAAIQAGVDMFDCVMPTRNARNGGAFTRYGKLQIRNSCHRESQLPLDNKCSCYCCRNFSRSYLHHLFSKKVEEILGLAMLTLHNITFYNSLMSEARLSIRNGRFLEFTREFLNDYFQKGAGGDTKNS